MSVWRVFLGMFANVRAQVLRHSRSSVGVTISSPHATGYDPALPGEGFLAPPDREQEQTPSRSRRRAFAISRHAWLALGVPWLLLTAKLLLCYRFYTFTGVVWGVADDAYITADFSRTLAHGGGPLWYMGAPKVEGFSSPLWMLAIAPLHWLPGFTENRLGRFVFGLNAALLLGCAWASLRAFELTVRTATGGRAARSSRSLAYVWLPLGAVMTVSFCVWTARGFEVALVAFLVLSSYVAALRPEGVRPVRLGLLMGLAIWARMDACLYLVPTAVALLGRRSEFRRAGAAILIAGGLVGAMLLARFLYFGDLFPNTYYLKATKWPIPLRLPNGIRQNIVSLWVCALGLPAICFVLWRWARSGRLLSFALIVTHLVVVVYSTSLGGDFSFEAFGFDRFTCVGLLFLVIGLACVVRMTELPALPKLGLMALCIFVTILPLLSRPVFPGEVLRWREFKWAPLFKRKEPPIPPDGYANLFVHAGKSVKEITLPGAKVAMCSAGAVVYFSHRNGVDLLGKVDPVIAHLPATSKRPVFTRCWRDNVGHNKEDMGLSYRLHEPDLFTVQPPPEAAPRYVHFRYRTLEYWALRDSPHIPWAKVWPLAKEMANAS